MPGADSRRIEKLAKVFKVKPGGCWSKGAMMRQAHGSSAERLSVGAPGVTRTPGTQFRKT